MGFGKAFGFGLLAYIGLNFLFVIISRTISDDLNALFGNITADPLILIILLMGPIINLPGLVFQAIYGQIMTVLTPAVLIELIGYVVSPFIAAIVAGRMGETKGGSFGGWILAMMISAIGICLIAALSPATLIYYGLIVSFNTYFLVIISALVNGIFYGCIALLFTKTEYY
jgi:hypothetical protein